MGLLWVADRTWGLGDGGRQLGTTIGGRKEAMHGGTITYVNSRVAHGFAWGCCRTCMGGRRGSRGMFRGGRRSGSTVPGGRNAGNTGKQELAIIVSYGMAVWSLLPGRMLTVGHGSEGGSIRQWLGAPTGGRDPGITGQKRLASFVSCGLVFWRWQHVDVIGMRTWHGGGAGLKMRGVGVEGGGH